MFSYSTLTIVIILLLVAYFIMSGIVAITTGKTLRLKAKYTDESVEKFAKTYGAIYVLFGVSLLLFFLGSHGNIHGVFTYIGIALTLFFAVFYIVLSNKKLEKR